MDAVQKSENVLSPISPALKLDYFDEHDERDTLIVDDMEANDLDSLLLFDDNKETHDLDSLLLIDNKHPLLVTPLSATDIPEQLVCDENEEVCTAREVKEQEKEGQCINTLPRPYNEEVKKEVLTKEKPRTLLPTPWRTDRSYPKFKTNQSADHTDWRRRDYEKLQGASNRASRTVQRAIISFRKPENCFLHKNGGDRLDILQYIRDFTYLNSDISYEDAEKACFKAAFVLKDEKTRDHVMRACALFSKLYASPLTRTHGLRRSHSRRH